MPNRNQDVPEEYIEHGRVMAHAIGARIRQRRRQLKLTQKQVQVRLELESVHISRPRFSRLERGAYLPDAVEIVGLSKTLEVSYRWLLEGIEE